MRKIIATAAELHRLEVVSLIVNFLQSPRLHKGGKESIAFQVSVKDRVKDPENEECLQERAKNSRGARQRYMAPADIDRLLKACP